ncbi:TPA: 50S ribosomal protein L13 [Candidatus Bathyarchaeota archaeon]|nr:50S ribosomal protein L13 [Candidatus Bathyarchaeota archaeon]HIJ08687.1 50S ribosomal protein L13 [Candidatus Bathyarchaeota archaeon]
MQTTKSQPKEKTSKPKATRIFVDAEGLILGRMCSKVAKKLLNGEEVVILNSEKTIISGKRKSKVAEAKQFLEVGAPRRGPFHYRRPDMIVRKTVKGMLPAKQPKGKKAFENLRVYMGIPFEFKDQKTERFPEAESAKLKGPKLTLGELAKELGWNKVE